MLWYSVTLTLVVLAVTALLGLVIAVMLGPYRRRLRHLYQDEAQRQSLLVESIHGMRTRERARGRGLAKQLIAAFFAAGRARGLDRAFLQVEEDNLIARQAYQSCGFNTAWRYHYWHKP